MELGDTFRAANLILKKTASKICEFQVFATNFVEQLRIFRIFHDIVHLKISWGRAGAEAEVPERATPSAEAVLLADACAELHAGPA
jgi:hypothetical protein